MGGHSNAVEVLADVGANINARDCDGMTPLHLAAFYGQAMVAVKLVEHGGDLVAVSSSETGALTPAEVAVEGGHKGTAKVLLDLLRTLRDAKEGRLRSAGSKPLRCLSVMLASSRFASPRAYMFASVLCACLLPDRGLLSRCVSRQFLSRLSRVPGILVRIN